MAIITLTTDFGTRDGYVGAMKGVIARRAPSATVVDIAHDIPPGDVAHAAWVLATSTLEFPSGTIHVVVVDPGVGGERQAVVLQAMSRWFVGPDNGVFDYVLDMSARVQRVGPAVWALSGPRLRAELAHTPPPTPARPSATFHGRDVFAPAAARLADGEDASDFGSVTQLRAALPWGRRLPGQGRVVHIDRFGNIITDLPGGEAGDAIVYAGNTIPISRTYSDVEPGTTLAYVGSAGTVELAVRDGRADARLPCERGTTITPAGVVRPYR